MNHSWDIYNYCEKCGQSYESVLDNLTPKDCAASANVVPISSILAKKFHNMIYDAVWGCR